MDDLPKRAQLKTCPVKIGMWSDDPDAIEVSIGGEVIHTVAVVEDPETEAAHLIGVFRRVFDAGVKAGPDLAYERSLDFEAHLADQAEWSRETFGPGMRTAGIVAHIRKELAEIEAEPGDLEEWIDVVILALDGAWRTGATDREIIAALIAKTKKNRARTWPDWRTVSEDEPIEHVRSEANE